VSRTEPDRSLALRRSGIDRTALLNRLGDVDETPPEVHNWLSRAAMADRLPSLLGLDQQSSYELCVDVVRHLSPKKPGTPR
jgi:hypothetical protein